MLINHLSIIFICTSSSHLHLLSAIAAAAAEAVVGAEGLDSRVLLQAEGVDFDEAFGVRGFVVALDVHGDEFRVVE